MLPAAFIVTALVAGAGGYIIHGAAANETAAGSATGPGSSGAGTAPNVNQPMDAKGVYDRLVASGLPLTNPMPADKAHDPGHLLGTQGGYTSRTAFSLPGGDPQADQYGLGRGGIIEVFANASDAQQRADGIREWEDHASRKDRGGCKAEGLYRAGLVLVRVSGCVDRSLADTFSRAVAALDNTTPADEPSP